MKTRTCCFLDVLYFFVNHPMIGNNLNTKSKEENPMHEVCVNMFRHSCEVILDQTINDLMYNYYDTSIRLFLDYSRKKRIDERKTEK